MSSNDEHINNVANVIHRVLKVSPPATATNYEGKSYNSMDHNEEGDHHSWLQTGDNKHDYHAAYVNALKNNGYKIKRRTEGSAQMTEGTAKGVTHHLEVSKDGQTAHVRHSVETAHDEFPTENYHEVSVQAEKHKATPGHPSDNFRQFLHESGHMETVRKALADHYKKNN